MSEELKPCPFCGTQPKLPDGDGTQYEIWCEDCGGAVAAVQICDLMTLEERAADSFKSYRYGEEFVERAKLEAIDKWNTRAQPDEQQDEPVELPRVPSLQDDRCPRHHLIADGFRSGADWMRREIAGLGPLYRRPAAQAVKLPDVDHLAQIIRQVDGNHSLGAGALAEKILEALNAPQ